MIIDTAENHGQSPDSMPAARRGMPAVLGECGTLPIFPSDVKARHDKLVDLVTRTMELRKQQARAPKKQSPSAKQLLDQKLSITDQQIDALVYELYGLTEDEVCIVEEAARP